MVTTEDLSVLMGIPFETGSITGAITASLRFAPTFADSISITWILNTKLNMKNFGSELGYLI